MSVPASFDPNTAQNVPEIEKQMAVRCVEHAQTYWNLLEKIDPKGLRLTKLDDEIYADFMETFPEVDPAKKDGDTSGVQKIDEDTMKGPSKKRWHDFIAKYEKKVADYNFSTLVRTDSSDEYSQTNTTFVPRMQFYVFEIARNRHGLNDWVRDAKKAEDEKKLRKAAKKK